jgi:dipeptidyl aminopeptidase/acylaminoacyl peptidase
LRLRGDHPRRVGPTPGRANRGGPGGRRPPPSGGSSPWREYEGELGPPWKAAASYLKLSFPHLHSDRIATPTLFPCGENDFNVPLLNNEQRYQALRSLGVETKLVSYPGQFHIFTKPSYLQDRMRRYLDWYDQHLK